MLTRSLCLILLAVSFGASAKPLIGFAELELMLAVALEKSCSRVDESHAAEYKQLLDQRLSKVHPADLSDTLASEAFQAKVADAEANLQKKPDVLLQRCLARLSLVPSESK